MSRRFVGVLVLLALSVLLGVLAGEFFFRIWIKTVPNAVTTSFNTASAHAYYLWSGAEVGLAFFAWGYLAPLVSRMFRPKPEAPAAART